MRKVLLFVVSLFYLLPMSAFANIPDRPTTSGFVFDYQNVIDDEIENEINEFSKLLDEQGVMQLFIVTVPTIGDLEPFEYGVKMIRAWGIGEAATNNGMLIFATTDQGEKKNKVRIAVGQGLEGDYPDGKLGRMLDEYMMPSLADGDYTGAFASVVNAIKDEEAITYEWTDAETFTGEIELTWWDWIFVALVLIVALVTAVVIIYVVFQVIKDFFTGEGGSGGGGSSSSDDYQTSYSSYSSSSDDFSGGGGDSAGGGSDRSF